MNRRRLVKMSRRSAQKPQAHQPATARTAAGTAAVAGTAPGIWHRQTSLVSKQYRPTGQGTEIEGVGCSLAASAVQSYAGGTVCGSARQQGRCKGVHADIIDCMQHTTPASAHAWRHRAGASALQCICVQEKAAAADDSASTRRLQAGGGAAAGKASRRAAGGDLHVILTHDGPGGPAWFCPGAWGTAWLHNR